MGVIFLRLYSLDFVRLTSKLSVIYREDRTRYSMQLIADIVKKLIEDKLLTQADLYNLKESEVIDMIEKHKYSEIFNKWKNAKKVKTSEEEPKNVYYVKHPAKIRYIIPLVSGKRITDICKLSKNMIDKNLNYDMNKYVYLDFNL